MKTHRRIFIAGLIRDWESLIQNQHVSCAVLLAGHTLKSKTVALWLAWMLVDQGDTKAALKRMRGQRGERSLYRWLKKIWRIRPDRADVIGAAAELVRGLATRQSERTSPPARRPLRLAEKGVYADA